MRLGLKEAGLQISVLTNRNRIGGIVDWVSKHIFVRPKIINKGQLCRYGRDRMKEDALTWGGLGIDSFSMCQEVSRGHSTCRKRATHNSRGLTSKEGLNDNGL